MNNHRFITVLGLVVCTGVCGTGGVAFGQDEKPVPAADPSAAASVGPSLDAENLRAVESLLSSMSSEVLKGDAAAYLKNIDRRDACFVAEQTYWANDLKKFPALAFEQKLEDARADGTDAAVGKLTWTWKVKKGEGEPKERTVTFDARFTKTAEGWRYAGEQWLRRESKENGNVLVLFQPGFEELAEGICEVFPEIRAHVEEGFGITVPRVQEVKMYASMKHLQAGICLSYTDGLGGWNEPGESIRQLVRRKQTGKESMTVLAHEFGHVCTFELGPKSNEMPWWVLEGVAELSAEHFAKSHDRNDEQIRRMKEKGRLAEWKDLTTFGEVTGENYGKVYSQGHHMLGFISETFGREKRVAWLRKMATGSTLDDATKSELGMPFAELDAKWRESLKPLPEAPKKEESHKEEPKKDGSKEAATPADSKK